MTRFLVLSAALLALAGGGPASAQTVGVRTLALQPGEMPKVYLRTAENYSLLEWSTRQPSETVRALRASPLPFYRLGTDEDGKPDFVPDRKVALPSGARGILLLGWTAGDEVNYIAIEDDFAGAGFNDWLLINTGKRPIAFQAGEKSKAIMVAPGKSTRYRITAAKGEGATVLAQAPFDGEAKTFYSTYWPVHADKRTVVLFIDDGRKIRVKRISDKLVQPER